MEKPAFLSKISLPLFKVAIRESKDSKWYSSRPVTRSRISVLSETTRGLALRLWGAIGVNTKDFAVGAITGPPQLKEYPVDPVGVETISPSAQ